MIARWFKALYNFVVGDPWILLGTLLAVGSAAVIARVAPLSAGGLLVVVLAITLVIALWREITPQR